MQFTVTAHFYKLLFSHDPINILRIEKVVRLLPQLPNHISIICGISVTRLFTLFHSRIIRAIFLFSPGESQGNRIEYFLII
jgi:hypothetical protein